MGFGSKTKIYSSSSVYNLAGEYSQRNSKIFQAMVLGAAIKSGKGSVASAIQQGIASSHTARQRRFFGWAKDNYGLGMPIGYVSGDSQADRNVVRAGLTPLLGLTSNQSLEILLAVIDGVEVEYFAESWISEHRPLARGEEWTPSYIPSTGKIRIDFGNDDIVELTAPPDFVWAVGDRARRLLYVSYRIVTIDPQTKVLTTSIDSLFTYRLGSGNVTFDTLVTAQKEPMAEFFPCIPLRVDNQPVDTLPYFDDVAKAYRKVTGSKIEEILEQIEDNEQVNEIDFCFMTFGVSLNTEDASSKRYLYEFFRELGGLQLSPVTFSQMNNAVAQTKVSNTAISRWVSAHDGKLYAHPLFGTAAPQQTSVYVPQTNAVRVYMPEFTHFDLSLNWNSIKEIQRLGNGGLAHGKPALSVGQVLIYHKPVVHSYLVQRSGGAEGDGGPPERVTRTDAGTLYLIHQTDKTRYRELQVEGLVHANKVYGSSIVRTNVLEAFEDEDESCFLVPLHMPTLRKLGARHSIEMSASNTYLLFNTYKKQKVKWYQRGIFKVILFIAAIAISVLFPPAGAAAGGLLGTNAAVGVAMGAAAGTMTALIAGAIANAMVAMIVTNVISKASVSIFGDKLGAIIGTIASFVAMTYANTFAATGTFNVDWGKMMNITNLSKLTNAVSSGYAQFMAADTADIYAEMENLKDVSKEALDEIQRLSEDILGMTGDTINPMMLLDAREHFGESSDAFLTRTLLTGSDLAELTHALIEDFAEISLKLPELTPSTTGFA
jgi:hypothetical protein